MYHAARLAGIGLAGDIPSCLLAGDDRSRPQDGADLRALRAVVNDEEVARARQAAGLIQQRGFARRGDLERAVDD